MAVTTPPQGTARPRTTTPERRPAGSGADTGWAVTGTLISGMAVWGGGGWLLDQWADTRVFFPVGVVVGMTLAIYLVVARFGHGTDSVATISSTSYSTYRKNPGGRRSQPRTQKGHR